MLPNSWSNPIQKKRVFRLFWKVPIIETNSKGFRNLIWSFGWAFGILSRKIILTLPRWVVCSFHHGRIELIIRGGPPAFWEGNELLSRLLDCVYCLQPTSAFTRVRKKKKKLDQGKDLVSSFSQTDHFSVDRNANRFILRRFTLFSSTPLSRDPAKLKLIGWGSLAGSLEQKSLESNPAATIASTARNVILDAFARYLRFQNLVRKIKANLLKKATLESATLYQNDSIGRSTWFPQNPISASTSIQINLLADPFQWMEWWPALPFFMKSW